VASSDPLPAQVYEQHYLGADSVFGGSGHGGDAVSWEAVRRPIVEAIDSAGTFLDIGCANGLLMESVAAWSTYRIEPYGLDFAGRLVELARRRLPQWADRIHHGDALTWDPPRRFDFVRTELVYVAAEDRRRFVERLLARVVAPGGRLLVCGYGGETVRETVRGWGYEPEFELGWVSPRSGLACDLVALGVEPAS
jgi:SAM-dependent methyltransferase